MPRRRVDRPVLPADEILVFRHQDPYDVRGNAPRDLVAQLPGGDPNEVLEQARRGRWGLNVVLRVEGRRGRVPCFARVVIARPNARAPRPVRYGSPAAVARGVVESRTASDRTLRQQVASLAAHIEKLEALFGKMVELQGREGDHADVLERRVAVLEAKEQARLDREEHARRVKQLTGL